MVNRTSVLAPARRTAAAEAGEHDAARARTYHCKKQAVRRRGEAEEDDDRKKEGRTGEEGEGRAQGEGAREKNDIKAVQRQVSTTPLARAPTAARSKPCDYAAALQHQPYGVLSCNLCWKELKVCSCASAPRAGVPQLPPALLTLCALPHRSRTS